MPTFAKMRWGATVIGALVVAVGCSFGTSSSSSGSANKTLVVDTSFRFDSMDPNFGGGQTNFLADTQIYQTLLQPNQANTAHLDPLLAQSYVATPDGLTVTFMLRHNIRFSDGTPLTSADVVFSLMRLKYINGVNSSLMASLTASAPDPYTVVVTSSTPDVFLASKMSYAATSILNSKVAQANGANDSPNAATADTAGTFLNQQSLGSGPYELVSADPKVQIVMRANPNYWGGGNQPVYSKVIIRNEADTAQVLDVQQQHDQIALDMSPQEAATTDKSKVSILNQPSLETWSLILNANPATSTTTANLQVRQAVRYAIDYKALLGLAGAGAVQAQGLLPTGVPGALPASQVTAQDVSKAKALLAQSGLANPTIVFEYASDATFFGLNPADVAQVIQSNLKDIGLTVTLQPEPNVVVRTRFKAGKVQMLMQPLGGNSFDATGEQLYYFPGVALSKFFGWQTGMNPASDAAAAQITANTDPTRVATLFMQEQAAENDFAVYIPLFRSPLVLVASKSIGNLNLDSLDISRFWELT